MPQIQPSTEFNDSLKQGWCFLTHFASFSALLRVVPELSASFSSPRRRRVLRRRGLPGVAGSPGVRLPGDLPHVQNSLSDWWLHCHVVVDIHIAHQGTRLKQQQQRINNNNNNNNTIWGGSVLTGEEPPPPLAGGPTQSQLSRPLSSRTLHLHGSPTTEETVKL